MSLSALSTNRNYVNCCDDIRPFLSIVETGDTPTTTAAASGGTVDIDIGDIDELNVSLINANIVNANTMNTNTLNTSFISSFTVDSGDDVVFRGVSSINQMFWDSSRNTLYLQEAFLKTSECYIYLNNDSSENPLGITQANRDNGILFKWFDDSPGIGATEEKLGFFGFIDEKERFRFIPNVDASGHNIVSITQANGDFEMQDAYVRSVINENVSDNLGISSVTDVNVQADDINLTSLTNTTINSVGGDVNISTDGGDVNIDVTGNYNKTVYNGVIDILVNGDENDDITIENTLGTIDILSGSTSSQAIFLNTNNGGILIENESSNEDIIIKSSNSVQLTTTGSTVAEFNETDGLTVNRRKTDYLQWVPYYKFDAFSGIWISNRSTPSNPLHFWQKDAAAETTRIYADFEVSSRTTTDKGFQLTSIFFAYNITTAAITSITPTITLKEFNPAIPGAAPTLTNIAFTDVQFSSRNCYW